MLTVGCPEQLKPLRIGANFGGKQGTANLLEYRAAFACGLLGRPRQHLGRGHSLGLLRADGAGKHGVRNGGRCHAKVQRDLAGPLARAFLLGRVQNQIDQCVARFRVGMGQDVGSDADQVAAEVTVVPGSEHRAHLSWCHSLQVMHEPVGFADHLHVGVFNAVVHHLDEVARTTRPHPFAARLAIVGCGGNGLQHRLDQRPSLRGAPGHESRAEQGPLFAPAHASTDEVNAFASQRGNASLCVCVQRVAAVNDNVAA